MIGDDEPVGRTAVEQRGVSKESLRQMLSAAVANTPGAVKVAPPRMAMGCNSDAPDQPPTAYQVAVAIVVAAREMGADAESVALGVTTRGGRYTDHSIPRARAYAAYAIREVFPRNGSTAIGRWVGAKLASSYMSLLESQRRGGQIRWWDEALFRRVVAKLKVAA